MNSYGQIGGHGGRQQSTARGSGRTTTGAAAGDGAASTRGAASQLPSASTHTTVNIFNILIELIEYLLVRTWIDFRALAGDVSTFVRGVTRIAVASATVAVAVAAVTVASTAVVVAATGRAPEVARA